MREIVKVSDIQVYTGKKEAACYKELRRIKAFHNKKPHQSINISEYNKYYGFTDDSMRNNIIMIDAKKEEAVTKSKPPDSIKNKHTEIPKDTPYQITKKTW